MKRDAQMRESALLAALLDKTNDVGGRDDAAMDLEHYDSPDVVSALLSVAYDPHDDDTVAESAGESLAAILLRGKVTVSIDRARLSGAAQFGFDGRIEAAGSPPRRPGTN